MAGISTVEAAMIAAGVVLSQPVVSTTRIDGIAVQDLDQPQIGQVAVERGRGPPAVLEDGMHREFHRDAAGVANAVAHAPRQVEMHAVAGIEVAAALRDADDGPPAAQFLRRECRSS